MKTENKKLSTNAVIIFFIIVTIVAILSILMWQMNISGTVGEMLWLGEGGSPACTATDPPYCSKGYPCGDSIFVKGITKCPGGTCNDRCIDSKFLYECFCLTPSGKCEYKIVDCSLQFIYYGSCKNGACVEGL